RRRPFRSRPVPVDPQCRCSPGLLADGRRIRRPGHSGRPGQFLRPRRAGARPHRADRPRGEHRPGERTSHRPVEPSLISRTQPRKGTLCEEVMESAATRRTLGNPDHTRGRDDMSDATPQSATFTVDDHELQFERVRAVEGNDGVKISSLLKETGLVTLDYGFGNTANCESQVTFIDGGKGILRYRGYPIEQLAEQSSFLEVAYLLIHGELPSAEQLSAFTERIERHTHLHDNFKALIGAFPAKAHPMAVLSSAVSAIPGYYPESTDPFDQEAVELATALLLAKLPTITAYAFRHLRGEEMIGPDQSLGYLPDFLRMSFANGGSHEVDPELVSALNLLLILHADHEQNCSASTVRIV